MNIEDLSRRLLVGISLEISKGEDCPYIRDLAHTTSISEAHTKRLLKKLRSNGLIVTERHSRASRYELTIDGQSEVKELREYFRLS